jgi:hypothetical protein
VCALTKELFPPEAFATEWADKICNRLSQIGVAGEELVELRVIIFNFTRIAIEEMSANRQVEIPHSTKPFEIDETSGQQIIELFLRGLTNTAKKLRSSGKSWEDRKDLLEKLAWKLFNLAKILVSLLYIPSPKLGMSIQTEKEIQTLMKQSSEALYREQVEGISAKFPFM